MTRSIPTAPVSFCPFRLVCLALLIAAFLVCAASHPAFAQAPDITKDVNMMQVAIEALVVEVNEDKTQDLGVQLLYNRNDSSNPSNVIQGLDTRFPVILDPVQVPTFTDVGTAGDALHGLIDRTPGIGATLSGMNLGPGTVSANLRALLEEGDAIIRTRPIVVALNKTPATITTEEEIPYQDVVFDAYGRSQLSVLFTKVGVKLTVTPRIIEPAEKQRIELDITKMEISGVSKYITLRKVNRPLFVTSEANSKVVLHNAETLVIGGLKSSREVTQENRVPYLGAIPGLGWLFKSQHMELKDTDVLFFITPYILLPGTNPLLPFDFVHNKVLLGSEKKNGKNGKKLDGATPTSVTLAAGIPAVAAATTPVATATAAPAPVAPTPTPAAAPAPATPTPAPTPSPTPSPTPTPTPTPTPLPPAMPAGSLAPPPSNLAMPTGLGR